jgi:hypothetical protein
VANPPVNSITQLVNNVAASVDGLLGTSLSNSQGPGVPNYPAGIEGVDEVLSNIDPSNWIKLSYPYTFSVMDLEAGQIDTAPFTDFALPLAPGSIHQSEEFAISIKPTQGGTSTTHSGNRYKTLLIKGTTGIAPFKGTGGAAKSDGTGIGQPDSLKYRSGYEVFLRLRNWFRAYYEYKKTAGSAASGLRLVFKNYKDGEFLIVELLKFDMDRQAARSFLYDYSLEFKVLSHLTFPKLENTTTDFENALNSAVAAIDTARGVFLRTQDILRQIESTYESVVVEPLRKSSLALKALLGVPTVAADMGSKAITNTVSVAGTYAILLGIQTQQNANKTTGSLDPRLASASLPKDLKSASATQGASAVVNLNEALMALAPSVFPEATRTSLANDQADAASLPRSFYENTLNDLTRVKDNAEDFFNLGSPVYDQIFRRTATLSASASKTITQDELDVLNAFSQAQIALRLLLSTEDLFKSSFDARIQDIINRFSGNIVLLAQPAVRQIKYTSGMTLERLAQKQLGDSSRWGEIAEVNQLKPPYITDDLSDTREGLLKPGDNVLIPAPSTGTFSQVPATRQITTTMGLTELEKSLGTDLKLTKDFDLSISNSGDLEVVSGTENLGQAVVLKLGYEQGQVMKYPLMGASIIPGTKFPPLETIRAGITNTLLQDTRIAGIQELKLSQQSGSLVVSFNLLIKNIDIPVPISIKI